MIKASDISSQGWFPDLDRCICAGAVRVFRTKNEAQAAAREFCWTGKVQRLVRRFEVVWIVGAVNFQPSYAAGVKQDVLRVPLLCWDKNEFGTKFQPVAEFRRATSK